MGVQGAGVHRKLACWFGRNSMRARKGSKLWVVASLVVGYTEIGPLQFPDSPQDAEI